MRKAIGDGAAGAGLAGTRRWACADGCAARWGRSRWAERQYSGGILVSEWDFAVDGGFVDAGFSPVVLFDGRLGEFRLPVCEPLRAWAVCVGWDVCRGTVFCVFWVDSFAVGLGTLPAATVGARTWDCGGRFGFDTDSVWDGFGDLYALGALTGEFGAGV